MLRFLLIYLLCWSAFAQTRIQENVVEIGRKTSTADKQIKLHKGDGSFAIIEWDGASNKFKQSLDNGVSFKDFGAGEGSTGGLQVLSNAGFEDGITTGWTSSVGDTSELVTSGCTLGTNCPLQGEKSLRFNPSAQNDYFESSLTTLPEALYGVSCEARFKYIGGDTNLSAYVINGDGETVGQYRNQSGLNQLPAHSIAGYESVYFLCPSKASVVADNDKGDLKIKINNDGASAAVDADYDDFYLGNFLGLSESVLPDTLTAIITAGAAITSTNTSPNWISSCTNPGAGSYTCTVSGLTQIASCGASEIAGSFNQHCDAVMTDASTLVITCDNSNAAPHVGINVGFNVWCHKQGADAKQSVQIFKSIPKIADNDNNFSAFIASDGGVTNENVDWINGNCTISETSRYTCNYISNLGLSNPMNCTYGIAHNLGSEIVTVLTNSTTLNAHYTYAPAGTQVQRAHWIHCQKSGSDYKTPVVQPIIVNQVETKKAAGIRTEACRFDNNGTATVNNESQICDWVTGVTRDSAGVIVPTFSAFAYPPVCTCTSYDPTNQECVITQTTTTSAVVRTYTAGGGAADANLYLQCKGAR